MGLPWAVCSACLQWVISVVGGLSWGDEHGSCWEIWLWSGFRRKRLAGIFRGQEPARGKISHNLRTKRVGLKRSMKIFIPPKIGVHSWFLPQLFVYLKGKKRELTFTSSFLQFHMSRGSAGQVQEPGTPFVTGLWWQRPEHSAHHSSPPRMCTNRKLG